MRIHQISNKVYTDRVLTFKGIIKPKNDYKRAYISGPKPSDEVFFDKDKKVWIDYMA